MVGIQQTSEEEPFAVEGKSALFTWYAVGIVTEFLYLADSIYRFVHLMHLSVTLIGICYELRGVRFLSIS